MIAYPRPVHILGLSLVTFPLAQLLIFPLVAHYDEHLGLIAAEITILSMLLIFSWQQRWTPEDLLLANATHPSVLIGTAVAAVGGALLVAEVDLLCAHVLSMFDISTPLRLQRELLELQIVRGWEEAGKTLAAIVIAPGVCEETFFRGFVFVTLVVRWGCYVAVPVSSMLFAAVHLNPWQFPALLLFGIFLALLVYWTHSIYPTIIAHMINNCVSVIGVNMRVHSGTDIFGSAQLLPWPVLVGALFLLFAGVRYARARAPVMPLIVGS